MGNTIFRGAVLTVSLVAAGCSSSSSGNTNASGGAVAATGGSAAATGGASSSATGGASSASGGVAASGGSNQAGGSISMTSATGGRAATGGGQSPGGTSASSGGHSSMGGSSVAGSNATGGGSAVTGGAGPTGGKGNGGSGVTGGAAAAGGNANGGTPNGGTAAAGGGSAMGGASSATGGSTTTTTGVTGVTVQLDQTHQTIEGFGINDTWGSSLSDSQATQLFDATSGIGLTILRVGMSSTGAFYNSDESTRISQAKSHGATKIIGSTWTAPANCKDNNSLTGGGHLKSSCYDSWSTTIANFAKSNNLYAMSIGNEPEFASCGSNDPCNGNYDTMLYTANEMVAFVKVAGPKLQQAGVKVIAPETSEWLHFWSNISAGPDPGGHNSSDPLKCGCFGMTIDDATKAKCASTCNQGSGYDYGHYMAADADAWKAFDIIGVHEYDSQMAYAWPSDVTAAKKEIWQTEMSGVKWWPEQGPSSDIANGVAVAGWIHSALVVGEASAWLWWWYSQTGDNEGLMLGSTDTKRHYTLGNYSKFVRPGYVMVSVAGNSDANLLLSAFKGTDGTVAVVAINKGSSAATVPITISGGTAPASCTPNVTSSSDNLKAGTAVTVTNGTFSAALAATTVTTFVCK